MYFHLGLAALYLRQFDPFFGYYLRLTSAQGSNRIANDKGYEQAILLFFGMIAAIRMQAVEFAQLDVLVASISSFDPPIDAR
jgi:hypothetical protein